ncbi:hypothetical protein K439DRAFT_1626313 [Ramaria rubella]|nr:hypothetical protein K439DRAFT_1626313 [Ramaria rubella]
MNPSRRAPHTQRDPELGARVRKDATLKRVPDELEGRGDLSLVLSAIVRHAGPEYGLNEAYRDPGAAGDLVESNDALREAVQDAWGKGEYHEILALEILQFRRTSPAVVTSTGAQSNWWCIFSHIFFRKPFMTHTMFGTLCWPSLDI